VTRSSRGEPLDSSTVVSDTCPSDSIRTSSTTVPRSVDDRESGGKLSLQNWRSDVASSGLASAIRRSNGGVCGSSRGTGAAAKLPGPRDDSTATNNSGGAGSRTWTGLNGGTLIAGGRSAEGSRMTSIAVANELCRIAYLPDCARNDGPTAAMWTANTAAAMRPRAPTRCANERADVRAGGLRGTFEPGWRTPCVYATDHRSCKRVQAISGYGGPTACANAGLPLERAREAAPRRRAVHATSRLWSAHRLPNA
jgi:hypothetical protein